MRCAPSGLRLLIIDRNLMRIAFVIWTTGMPFNPDKIWKRLAKKHRNCGFQSVVSQFFAKIGNS
jgi:hypothetical protein